MTFEEQLNSLAEFMAIDVLQTHLAMPLKVLPEPPQWIIPAIQIQSDGLGLTRVTLFSDKFLCDVHLDGEFDFSRRDSVVHYRIRLWTHEIKQPETDVVVTTYQVARVQLLHGFQEQFMTELNYAGDKRDVWLQTVLDVMPVSLVLTGADRHH